MRERGRECTRTGWRGGWHGNAAFAVLSIWLLSLPAVQAQQDNYGVGDIVDEAIFVQDAAGGSVGLRELLAERESRVNVVFIFGGGDLGHGNPGHLWCPDSFEDTHILRTLVGKYGTEDPRVEFIAIAEPPAYHSQTLGQPAGVFLNQPPGSEALGLAREAFVDSTLAAVDAGILPLRPYFDHAIALMLNRREDMLPPASYGELRSWHGAFRERGGSQFYGVPNFWLISDSGEVLAEPFRNNVYHPHGAEVRISYTYGDVDAAIASLLEKR